MSINKLLVALALGLALAACSKQEAAQDAAAAADQAAAEAQAASSVARPAAPLSSEAPPQLESAPKVGGGSYSGSRDGSLRSRDQEGR